MAGYLRAQRDRFDHPLFRGQKFCRGYAWDWMGAQAVFADTQIDQGGRIVTLRRGQFSHSVRYMADAWGWGKHAVENFLRRLSAEGMIAVDSSGAQTVITIVNYDRYQIGANSRPFDGSSKTGTPDGAESGTGRDGANVGNNEGNRGASGEAGTPSGTGEGTARGQHGDSTGTNNKEGKEDKGSIYTPPTPPDGGAVGLPGRVSRSPKVRGGVAEGFTSTDEEFEFVWLYYRKIRDVKKAVAKRAWTKARGKATYQEIVKPLGAFIRVQSAQRDRSKIPHFSTWLNGERWNDNPDHTLNGSPNSDARLDGLGRARPVDRLDSLFPEPDPPALRLIGDSR